MIVAPRPKPEFVETMRVVSQIFPDIATELRLPTGEMNFERMNVWEMALGRFRQDTVVEAARILAASEAAKRRPQPAEIARECVGVIRRAESPEDETRARENDERAARADVQAEREALRERVAEIPDDEIRRHLRLVAALNPELRHVIDGAMKVATPISVQSPFLLTFVIDRLDAGLGPSEMAGFRYTMQSGEPGLVKPRLRDFPAAACADRPGRRSAARA